MKRKKRQGSSSDTARVPGGREAVSAVAGVGEDLLMQQLHQVQEELELYYLKCLDLDADLQMARLAADDAKREIQALKLQLGHMQSELAAEMNRPQPQSPAKRLLSRLLRRGAWLGRRGPGEVAAQDARVATIRDSAWFDAAWYLKTYPDVREAGFEPAAHYHEFGWKEARNPGPRFDTSWYLRANPDVAAAGVDPLWHYLEHGSREGRSPVPS